MKLSTLARSALLFLALAALVCGLAAAQDFTASAIDNVELGPERDEIGSNKVPPNRGPVLTEDGRVRIIVRLADESLAMYRGGVPGLKATNAAANGRRKLNAKSAASVAYRDYLSRQQDAFVARLGKSSRVTVEQRYQVVLNAVALAVEPEMVEKIRQMPGVRNVYHDKMYYSSMDASLPLIEAQAFWDLLGGRDDAGAGIKVAVVDGGIRPENPMFDGSGFSFPAGFPLADDYCGAVDPGFCNGKLIAARHFRTVALHPSEHDSPLGFNGHGTHVAGIAVGNFVAGATASDGVPEDISGVAPGAWLMAYKALWWNGTTGSGSSIDLIAAVDAAVADGADVINNSWGGPGGEDPNTDAFGPTFEAANAAGVLSVVAAGNAGPGADSIGCPGCHEVALTVANTTTNRIHALGFNLVFPAAGPSAGCLEGTGPTLGAPVGSRPVVYSGDLGDPVGCGPLPAGSMTGSIALISRGACTFATKAANAAAAGADFMVVFNSVPGAPITMGGLGGSTISSCMISDTDGAAAVGFVQGNAGPEGEVTHPASRQTNDNWQDIIANSSSRGPNGDPSFLKPDIAAPGTRILSAHSPEQAGEFTFLTGTSMASPHVAGAAALMMQLHPTWSPEQVKTALTSTSIPVVLETDGVTPADAFDQGAGRLQLERARRAGATFDLPSMADPVCFGGCSFTRTLTNHYGEGSNNASTTWVASVEAGDPNLGITVTPDQVKLKPGESAAFQVDVDTSLVADDSYKFGAVIWQTQQAAKAHPSNGNKANVSPARLPVAVFAASSTDPSQLTKTVDKTSAEQGEVLTYDIALSNLTLSDPITLVDAIPANSTYVPGSASAIVDGLPDPSFVFDAGSNSLSWSGVLATQNLEWTASPSPFGFIPLSIFGIGPLTCSSVCDDTLISLGLGGFTFDYAGATYNSVVMGSNGFIVAGSDTTSAFTPFNQNMPDATPPNNVIAPFWTDLDLDGTSPTDSGAGNLRAAFLSGGGNTYLVLEWGGAQLFGAPGVTYSFQLWIQGGSSNIWAVYGGLSALPGSLTVGVEDLAGAAGASRYFNGSGTPPAVGSDLQVLSTAGGTASFTFQVEAGCDLAPVVNVVDVTSGATTISALAATEITAAPSCP